MFEEHGWEIPTTWTEFITLCETIEAEGIQPLYFGYKDTWTCLAPWNAIAVGVAPSDTCSQVNQGNTTFTAEYEEVAEKMKTLLDYAQPNPYAYSYNDACTAFARGESAMYVIGSYAVPQIQSVNPDMNIDSFVFPANEAEEDNVLNSGIDLQFCVMESCENKEAAYEVLRFLYEDETIQIYLDDQNAIPCKEGDFTLPSMLDGMKEYIDEGRMADFQDHHYPSEMSVDGMIQTFLMDDDANSVDTFLTRFDKDWTRYNRDLIRRVQDYNEEMGDVE
jgi:raffinose/stachyose/melibiose transport system substrate-binding protein